MKVKKVLPWVVLGGAAWLIWKACNLPQASVRPVYKPITSPPVYDHLYQDARMTEVVGK
jgi:hypothetical protein